MELTGTEFFVVKGDMRQHRLCELLRLDGHKARLMESPDSLKYIADARSVAVVSAAEPQIRQALKEKGVRVVEFSKCEACVLKHAAITAEAALLSAMLHSGRIVSDSAVMIIGFGRIGKELARLLMAWGCEAAVCVRKQQYLEEIARAGHKGIHIDDMHRTLPKCNLIFNTAPAPVLNHDMLALLGPTATVIDLASSPGGVDFEAADQLGVKAVHALALPGKLTPVSSAMAIKRAVYDLLGI